MTNYRDVLVFRTNIEYPTDKDKLHAIFSEIGGVQDWSVDMEDVDRVLRIVTSDYSVSEICALMLVHGYKCEELD